MMVCESFFIFVETISLSSSEMMTAMKVFRSSLIMEISNVLVKDDQNCGRLNSFWKFASPVNSSGFAILLG